MVFRILVDQIYLRPQTKMTTTTPRGMNLYRIVTFVKICLAGLVGMAHSTRTYRTTVEEQKSLTVDGTEIVASPEGTVGTVSNELVPYYNGYHDDEIKVSVSYWNLLSMTLSVASLSICLWQCGVCNCLRIIR